MLDQLYLIATIAKKDILDALKNRIVLYQIIAMTVILVSIKGLAFIIEPPALQVVIYDPAGSSLSEKLAESEDFSPYQAASLEELQQVISNMGFGLGPEIGLEIPPDFDVGAGQPEIKGYVSWANRNKAPQLKEAIEASLLALTGRSIAVDMDGNIITPPAEIGLLVGIVTIFAVTIILNNGIILVPALLIEEKQNHTLEALLVSPASIGQVVAGKAIAGAFYILITAVIVYLVYWPGVYHWSLTMLFILGAILFAVSLGLLFGVVFNRQQEMTGWLSLSLVFIVGSIFVEMLDMDLPWVVDILLPWMPPVALAKIFWASFSSQVDYPQILLSFGIVAVVSLVLFGVITWRIKRLDR